MAIHNAIKYGVNLIRAYSRFLGLGEDEEGVVRVGETLTPIVDQWGHPDVAFLRGERLLGASVNVAAVAAEFSGASLINPAGSSRICVLERAAAAGQRALLSMLDEATVVATFAGGVDEIHRDTRLPAIVTGPEFVRSGSDAALLGNLIDIRPSGEPFIAPPVVLTPGFAAIIQSTVVNTTLDVTFAWRSRAALPGEL